MGRFVSATGQFLLATYEHFSRPPAGSFSCPLTKMDAEAWLQAERRSMELGSWVAPILRMAEKKAKTVMLAEYAQTWIDQRHVKPRTRIGYQALHDRHIAPPLGRVPLTNLTPESVRGWFASLGSEHVRRNSHAYGLLRSARPRLPMA